VAQDEDDGHGREGKLRITQLTALLQEFELHLRKNEVEKARDRVATITTTLALALIDAQRRVVKYPVGGAGRSTT
jgi:multidrug resistance efflux pump